MHVLVLVPFREHAQQNRAPQLAQFLAHMPGVLDAALASRGHTWQVVVGEQTRDGRMFSRGRVLNALFRVGMAVALHPPGRVVLHDVDLLPDEGRAAGFVAPLPPGKAVWALAAAGGEYGGLAGYIGGICAMAPATFQAADGFPNALEGWGGEDDALRDAVGGLDAVAVFAAGSVLNLEVAAPPPLRARLDAAAQCPPDVRRAVRRRWRRAHRGGPDPEPGLAALAFYAAPAEDAGDARVRRVLLQVSDTAPLEAGWATVVSRTSSRTFVHHADSGASRWTPRPTHRFHCGSPATGAPCSTGTT